MNGRALRWLLIKLQPEAVTADHNTPHTAHIPAAERFRARPHERQHYRMYSYIDYTVFIYRLATFIYNFHKQAAPLVKTNHHVADGTLLQALPLSLPCPKVRSIQTRNSSTLALRRSLLQSHIMSDTARCVAIALHCLSIKNSQVNY